MLKPGQDAYVLALGPTLTYALEATQDLPSVGVVNARFIKPLDEAMLLKLAGSARALITVEDHAVTGGLGSAVAETLQDHGLKVPLRRLGIHDRFVPHGDPVIQHEALGLPTLSARVAAPSLAWGSLFTVTGPPLPKRIP